MWVRSFLVSLGSCVALRATPALVSEGVKKNTVQLALTLTDPRAMTGKSIDIAVDGVRRLSKTHPTQTGEPVVLHHIAKGSVVTAHVGTQSACAFWVTPGVEHCTVEEWDLDFTTVEENEEGIVSAALYGAYVHIVGWGSLVKIEVDHVVAYSFDSVAPNETLQYAGLQKGDLVRAVSAVTGETCMYRVGDADTRCHLDGTWGLQLGSVIEFGENNIDEGTVYTETKHYTVEFALERNVVSAKKLDIGLNGHQIASKMNAIEPGKSITVHHVKGGSVFTGVAHDIEKACCIYVGAGTGTQTVTCAGWTMNLKVQEETDQSFEHREMMFDVGFIVHRVSNDTTGVWGIEANDIVQMISILPQMFPGNLGGWSRGTHVVPFVNKVLNRDCVHVVGGGDVTTCEHNGWKFTIWSQLNMNKPWDGNNWDWEDTNTKDVVDPEMFEVRVTATDRTGSPKESTLECIARQNFDFYTLPLGETSKHIRKGTEVFKTKILTLDTPESVVKSATFVGQLPAGLFLEDGFSCTVYQEEHIMCEANTDGGSWTNNLDFTLEIEFS